MLIAGKYVDKTSLPLRNIQKDFRYTDNKLFDNETFAVTMEFKLNCPVDNVTDLVNYLNQPYSLIESGDEAIVNGETISLKIFVNTDFNYCYALYQLKNGLFDFYYSVESTNICNWVSNVSFTQIRGSGDIELVVYQMVKDNVITFIGDLSNFFDKTKGDTICSIPD